MNNLMISEMVHEANASFVTALYLLGFQSYHHFQPSH